MAFSVCSASLNINADKVESVKVNLTDETFRDFGLGSSGKNLHPQ